MKIYAIQDAKSDSTKLDLEKFTADLRELSDRHNVKLISIGAFSSADATGPAYLAVWGNEAEPIEKTL